MREAQPLATGAGGICELPSTLPEMGRVIPETQGFLAEERQRPAGDSPRLGGGARQSCAGFRGISREGWVTLLWRGAEASGWARYLRRVPQDPDGRAARRWSCAASRERGLHSAGWARQTRERCAASGFGSNGMRVVRGDPGETRVLSGEMRGRLR
jgi:hypothetical protein